MESEEGRGAIFVEPAIPSKTKLKLVARSEDGEHEVDLGWILWNRTAYMGEGYPPNSWEGQLLDYIQNGMEWQSDNDIFTEAYLANQEEE